MKWDYKIQFNSKTLFKDGDPVSLKLIEMVVLIVEWSQFWGGLRAFFLLYCKWSERIVLMSKIQRNITRDKNTKLMLLYTRQLNFGGFMQWVKSPPF